MVSELYWYSTCKRGEPDLLLQSKGCVQVADLLVQLEQPQEFYNYCILCKIYYSLTILLFFVCFFKFWLRNITKYILKDPKG